MSRVDPECYPEESFKFDQWYEENYDFDFPEEESDEWEDVQDAYNAYCAEQEELARIEALSEEYDYYLHLTFNDSREQFEKDMSELSTMIKKSAVMENDSAFFKMIYARSVTILEVYLQDITLTLASQGNDRLRNIIKNVEPFNNTKVNLKDISLEPDGIKKFVFENLSKINFHKISLVINVLKGILDARIDINQGEVSKVVAIRHLIVHRNGINKENQEIGVDLLKTEVAIKSIQEFVHSLQSELSNKMAPEY